MENQVLRLIERVNHGYWIEERKEKTKKRRKRKGKEEEGERKEAL